MATTPHPSNKSASASFFSDGTGPSYDYDPPSLCRLQGVGLAVRPFHFPVALGRCDQRYMLYHSYPTKQSTAGFITPFSLTFWRLGGSFTPTFPFFPSRVSRPLCHQNIDQLFFFPTPHMAFDTLIRPFSVDSGHFSGLLFNTSRNLNAFFFPPALLSLADVFDAPSSTHHLQFFFPTEGRLHKLFFPLSSFAPPLSFSCNAAHAPPPHRGSHLVRLPFWYTRTLNLSILVSQQAAPPSSPPLPPPRVRCSEPVFFFCKLRF